MLTTTFTKFRTKTNARKALSSLRKHYRVALRGSVVLREWHHALNHNVYRIAANLSGSGFSAADFDSAITQFKLHI